MAHSSYRDTSDIMIMDNMNNCSGLTVNGRTISPFIIDHTYSRRSQSLCSASNEGECEGAVVQKFTVANVNKQIEINGELSKVINEGIQADDVNMH